MTKHEIGVLNEELFDLSFVRASIVPSLDVPFDACPHDSAGAKTEPHREDETGSVRVQSFPQPKNYSWSTLLKRVFEVDVLVCELCGGPVRVIAAIQDSQTAEKILNCLSLPAKPPPTAPARYEHCSLPEYF